MRFGCAGRLECEYLECLEARDSRGGTRVYILYIRCCLVNVADKI